MKKVCVYQSLDALPDSYQVLFQVTSQRFGFFSSFAWFDNLIRNSLNIAYSVRLFGLEDDANGAVHALLPMCFSHTRQRWYIPRTLVAASNYYTSLFSLITGGDESQRQEDIALLAQAIIDETPRWDCIDLHPMAFDTGQFDTMQRAFRDTGAGIQTYFCFGNWYLKVDGRSFQEYFQSLPARLRNTIARKSKQLEKSQGLHISLIQSDTELDAALAAYEQVYQSSWKLPEAHPSFIEGLMRTCAQHGWLRLGIAYVGEQPVAAQLWIVHQRVASIYKLAYDEKFTRLSIGSILTSRMMAHVIDIDRVEEVDYLTGDDEYKQDWMSGRRERWGMIVFNPHTTKGKLSAIWHLGRQGVKTKLAALKTIFR